MLYPCTTLLLRSITTEPIVDQGKPSHKDTYEYSESVTIAHYEILQTVRGSAEFGWEPVTLFEVPAPTNFVSGNNAFTVTTGASGSSETKWYKIISRRLIQLPPNYLTEKSGEQEGLASKHSASVRITDEDEFTRGARHLYTTVKARAGNYPKESPWLLLDTAMQEITATHYTYSSNQDKVLSPEVHSPAAPEPFSRTLILDILEHFVDFVNNNSEYRATLAYSAHRRVELTKILQHYWSKDAHIDITGRITS